MAVFTVVGALFATVLKTIFASSASATITQTAVFLALFSVVHMLGNLSAVVDREYFDLYFSFWLQNEQTIMVLRALELYLGLGFIVHVLAAMTLSLRKIKMILKNPFGRQGGLLNVTAGIFMMFLGKHLLDFGYFDNFNLFMEGNITAIQEKLLATRESGNTLEKTKDVLQNKENFVIYVVGIGALYIHLLVGLAKTVGKIGLGVDARTKYAWFATGLSACTCYGFFVAALHFHLAEGLTKDMKITLAVVLPVTLLIQYLVSSFSSSSTSSPAKSSSTGSKEREITMAEVAQHTTAESLWMVINGDVVDVTAYMKAHPGGPDVLAANGGSDATKAFKEVPHSPDATKEVLKWKIGVLAKAKKISPDELAKRNTANDLWLAIDGKVVDVTKFAKEHPGGEGLIIEWAGKDGTKAFKDAHHSPDAVKMLQDYFVGDLAADGTQGVDLAKCLNVADIEKHANNILDPGALAYYNAGAEDGNTLVENVQSWHDYLLRPRVFVDVSDIDMSTEVLGHRLSLPIMAAPTALLKMGHPEGECAVAKGCFNKGVGNCLSTTASMSMEEVAEAAPGCYRWFQLYVYRDRERTRRLIERADKAGYSAICLTVDLPVLGNRTSLRRIGFKVPKQFKMANVASEKETAADKQASKESKDGQASLKDPGDRRAYVAKLYDQSLTLDLIPWIAEITKLPVVVKGVLRGDSAALAARYPNVRGIIVSNHGGRQLDGCISPLAALPDVIAAVKEVNVERKKKKLPPCEVYVDGGIRRGRDIFKAFALGAKCVLLGRPMIYGMAVGGDKGVERVLELLEDELKTCMQLCGCQDMTQIDESFVVKKTKAHSANYNL
eukprot:m.275759 g.275759  ORF g.275759 m.275759 type:complete len:838 (+) comp16294_c1_seq8:27-2540(+)